MRTTGTNLTISTTLLPHYTTTKTLHITLVITPTITSIQNHYQYSRIIEVIRGDPLVVLEISTELTCSVKNNVEE